MQNFDQSGNEGHEEIIPLTPNTQEAVTISFNGRYLLEFARAISTSSITIRYNDAHTSVAIPTTNDGCVVRYILMPVWFDGAAR